MEFSINAPQRPNAATSTAVDEQVEFHRQALKYGISHVSVAHHWISHPNVFLEPWPLMGYLQSQLPDATVSGFIALPLYQAVDMAEKVATMDHLSKGKFVLRAGVGWRAEEFEAIGSNVKYRGSRFEESINLCKQLWTGEAVTFKGRHFNVENARMAYTPLQKPHPPIWVGAQSEAAARRAARVGDAPWIPFQVGYEDSRILLEAYRDELGKVGKPYPERLPMLRFISVDRDHDAAVARMRPLEGFFTWYAASPNFTKVKVNYTHEEEIRERTIAGTPEEVVEGLSRYSDDFGVSVFDFFTLWPSTDPAEIKDHLAMIGTEVVAPLRARVPKKHMLQPA